VRQRTGIISSRDSLIAQGVDRIENRGPVRGIEAEEQADHAAHGEGEQYRVDVHDGVKIREYSYQPCQTDAEEHADESAERLNVTASVRNCSLAASPRRSDSGLR
jgi:hypothetical protein